MEERYELVNQAGAYLCLNGHIVIEPIAMCHHKSLKYELPTGYEYWKTRDRKFVAMSDGIIVLKADGWKRSVGVTDELEYARELGKDVHFITVQEARKIKQKMKDIEEIEYYNFNILPQFMRV